MKTFLILFLVLFQVKSFAGVEVGNGDKRVSFLNGLTLDLPACFEGEVDSNVLQIVNRKDEQNGGLIHELPTGASLNEIIGKFIASNSMGKIQATKAIKFEDFKGVEFRYNLNGVIVSTIIIQDEVEKIGLELNGTSKNYDQAKSLVELIKKVSKVNEK